MFGFAAPAQSRLGSIAGRAAQLQAVGQQQMAAGQMQPPLSAPTPGAAVPPMPQAGAPSSPSPLGAPPSAPQAYNPSSAIGMPSDVNMGAHGSAPMSLDSASGGSSGQTIANILSAMFGA